MLALQSFFADVNITDINSIFKKNPLNYSRVIKRTPKCDLDT